MYFESEMFLKNTTEAVRLLTKGFITIDFQSD